MCHTEQYRYIFMSNPKIGYIRREKDSTLYLSDGKENEEIDIED